MSSQTYKVRFGSHPPRAPVTELPAHRPLGSPPDHHPQAARYLAMAHRMEQLLREGTLGSYAAAGAWLGVSANRANLINDLAFLAAPIQDAVLCGDTRLSARQLREVARLADWQEQLDAVAALDPALAALTLQAEDSPRSPLAAQRRTT